MVDYKIIPINDQWQNSLDGNASGFVVKSYLVGTTTSTSMSIDQSGGTLVTSVTLNADGIPEVSGNEVKLYTNSSSLRIAIYENATDATNNTNAFYGPIDLYNLTEANGISKTFQTVASMIADTDLTIGDVVITLGYTSPNDGGGNSYEIVAAGTGTADNGSYINLTGISGQAEAYFENNIINVKKFGATGDGATDDTTTIVDAYTYAASVSGKMFIPAGTYNISSNLFWSSSVVDVSGEGSGNPGGSTSATVLQFTTDSTLFIGRSDASTIATLFGVTIGNFAVTGTGTQTGRKVQIAADRSTIYNIHCDVGAFPFHVEQAVVTDFHKLVGKNGSDSGLVLQPLSDSYFVNNNSFYSADLRGNTNYGLKTIDATNRAVRDNRFINSVIQTNNISVSEDAVRTVYIGLHSENNTTTDGIAWGSSAEGTLVFGANSLSETGTRPASAILFAQDENGLQGKSIDVNSQSSLELKSDGDVRIFFDTDNTGDQLEVYQGNATPGSATNVFNLLSTAFLNVSIVDFNLVGVGQILRATALGLEDQSSDPSNPQSGRCAIWQSDGTGSGDDGDIMIKITNSVGTTKTATLIDFSAV